MEEVVKAVDPKNHKVTVEGVNVIKKHEKPSVANQNGGKSWTVARLLELVENYSNNKCILVDATGEYDKLSDNMQSIELGTGEYVFSYRDLSIDELFFIMISPFLF